MGKVARPRIVTKERLDTTGLPEHVQVVLAEIARAAREVLRRVASNGIASVDNHMFSATPTRPSSSTSSSTTPSSRSGARTT